MASDSSHRAKQGQPSSKLGQLRRFGVGLTLRAWLVRAIRAGLHEFTLSQVGTSDNATNYPEHPDYHMAMIDWWEFQRCLGNEAEPHRAAFDRGDLCLATYHGAVPNCIVGYNFYTQAATRVNEEITFHFPDRFRYSYGAFTHPDHRGRGLSPARFTFFRRWRETRDDLTHNVYYIDVDNLPSMKSGREQSTREIVGYIGYWRRRPGGRLHCFASPTARRTGVRFARTDLPGPGPTSA